MGSGPRQHARAVKGGGPPDLRRPSQRRKATPPGTPLRHPHSTQCPLTRAHAVGQVPGPHAHTNPTRDTQVTEPRPPAPEDGRPGEGQRLTPEAPHNCSRPPPPPGTAPHRPRGTRPPQGMQAKGTVLGPHNRTPAPTARGRRTPTARPEGRQLEERERLTADAPHNGERHPPRGRPSATPTARNAGPQGRTLCAAGAGSPRPHQPHPGHTGRGTPAARPRGRAAGGGTAPDTRRPSQWWQVTPPGDGPPPPPRYAAPAGHASQGDSDGPPYPHTRAHSTWVTEPHSPPGGRAVGGREAPDLRRPTQRRKAPPPGTPFATPTARNAARRGARYGAGAGSQHPHQPHPGRTGRGTPAARPRGRAAGGGTAPDTRRPSQRWQAAPPGDGPPPPPRHAAPTTGASQGDIAGPPHPHNRAHNTWVAGPDSTRGQSREGDRLTSDAPHNGERQPPRGRPFATPTARNVGLLGRTLWGRCRVPTPTPTPPGTHRSRNPGRPPPGAGGRERDSA